ncbi:hypothetical protein WKI65_42915 [Streptomyces sp. MS1.AVA.3]|uniref:hypothetical protein n=1 Tax=Streptomyces decoyicus TaxID=249567 RepID=UPI0030C04E85
MCECCGRTGLKRTVALALVDVDGFEGEAMHYGTGCATTTLGWGWTNYKVAEAAKAAQRKADEAAAHIAARRQLESKKAAEWLELLRNTVVKRMARATNADQFAAAWEENFRHRVAIFRPTEADDAAEEWRTAYATGGLAAVLETVETWHAFAAAASN